jgi:hypothetical protein
MAAKRNNAEIADPPLNWMLILGEWHITAALGE